MLVKGKGGHNRVLPIPSPVMTAIDSYLAERGGHGGPLDDHPAEELPRHVHRRPTSSRCQVRNVLCEPVQRPLPHLLDRASAMGLDQGAQTQVVGTRERRPDLAPPPALDDVAVHERGEGELLGRVGNHRPCASSSSQLARLATGTTIRFSSRHGASGMMVMGQSS